MNLECQHGRAVHGNLFVGAVHGCLCSGQAMACSGCGGVQVSLHPVVDYLGLVCGGPPVLDLIRPVEVHRSGCQRAASAMMLSASFDPCPRAKVGLPLRGPTSRMSGADRRQLLCNSVRFFLPGSRTSCCSCDSGEVALSSVVSNASVVLGPSLGYGGNEGWGGG